MIDLPCLAAHRSDHQASVAEPGDFLLGHLLKDMEHLTRSLGKGTDDTIHAVHLLLGSLLELHQAQQCKDCTMRDDVPIFNQLHCRPFGNRALSNRSVMKLAFSSHRAWSLWQPALHQRQQERLGDVDQQHHHHTSTEGMIYLLCTYIIVISQEHFISVNFSRLLVIKGSRLDVRLKDACRYTANIGIWIRFDGGDLSSQWECCVCVWVSVSHMFTWSLPPAPGQASGGGEPAGAGGCACVPRPRLQADVRGPTPLPDATLPRDSLIHGQAVWSCRETVSLLSLTHVVEQHDGKDSLPLLWRFLQRVRRTGSYGEMFTLTQTNCLMWRPDDGDFPVNLP